MAVFAAVALALAGLGVPARVVLPLLAAHAVVSELVQHALLPGRSGDPLDVVADLAGVVLGGLAGVRVRRRDAAPAPRR